MTKKNNPKLLKKKTIDVKKSYIFDLDQRSKQIFKLIVNDFLKDGKPVGSRKLSIKMGEKLSAASVRNVMFDLQEAGLLRSNHTSSGRLPTDLGLRFFVDGLLQVGRITNNQCTEIQKVINNQTQNVEEMFSETSSLLSGLLDCAGIVLAPKLEGYIKHIEFVPVSNEKALVILVTDSGIIENRIIEVPKGLPPSLLIETTNYLNSIIKGKLLRKAEKL